MACPVAEVKTCPGRVGLAPSRPDDSSVPLTVADGQFHSRHVGQH
ncbi:MAG TPA: hypothetical protein VMQ44_03875 [Candidatus Saccharimonadales bacterium]|nr:hypothetical protein [Candidatus Saccharimonadales bacterium]